MQCPVVKVFGQHFFGFGCLDELLPHDHLVGLLQLHAPVIELLLLDDRLSDEDLRPGYVTIIPYVFFLRKAFQRVRRLEFDSPHDLFRLEYLFRDARSDRFVQVS